MQHEKPHQAVIESFGAALVRIGKHQPMQKNILKQLVRWWWL
jgi:hypothetical protein